MEPEKKEENKEEENKEKIEDNKENKKEENKEQKEEHVDKVEDYKEKEKENEENEEEEEKEEKEEEEKEEKEEEEEKEKKEKEEKKKKKKKEKKERKEKKKKEKKEKKEEKEKLNLIIAIDEENNICVDCEKKYPTKISINNGVIICEDCAKKHELLGHSISYIKDINGDLDEYLLNFLVFGSNSKFKRFLISEEVDPSLPIEKKYLTRACYFYRKNLKRKVKGEEIESKKDYKNANEIVENGENEFEEFDNYKIKSKIIHEGALKSKGNNAALSLNKLGGSILSVGKKMFGGIKYGSNFVAKKTEAPSKNIIKVAGIIGKRIGNTYEKIKNNILKGKSNENKEKEMIDNPPELNNPNFVETNRPLHDGEELNEENVQEQKEEINIDKEKIEDKKEEKEKEQQQAEDNNNEEKIDA